MTYDLGVAFVLYAREAKLARIPSPSLRVEQNGRAAVLDGH